MRQPQRHGHDDGRDDGDVGLADAIGVVVAEDDVGEVVRGVHDEDEAHVDDGEGEVEGHAQEVQGAGDLASAEHLGVPGEASDDGRRHSGTRDDH